MTESSHGNYSASRKAGLSRCPPGRQLWPLWSWTILVQPTLYEPKHGGHLASETAQSVKKAGSTRCVVYRGSDWWSGVRRSRVLSPPAVQLMTSVSSGTIRISMRRCRAFAIRRSIERVPIVVSVFKLGNHALGGAHCFGSITARTP